MATAVQTILNYNFFDVTFVTLGTAGTYQIDRDQVPTTVNDARGRESSFSLDQQGFEFHTHTSLTGFSDDKELFKATHYPEIAALLKEKTGASHVIPIDHLIRRQTWESAMEFARTHAAEEKTNMTVPARFVHVDQSYRGAETFLYDNVDEALAEKLTRSRWAIINVWRPLTQLKRDPLGVCDGRTVSDDDFMEKDLMLKGPNGKYEDISKGDSLRTWLVKRPHQEGSHKWWYLSDMGPDEVLLIKCFDSKQDGRCRRTPHSAFEDRRYTDCEARTSVEIRCLVFWEDQDVI